MICAGWSRVAIKIISIQILFGSHNPFIRIYYVAALAMLTCCWSRRKWKNYRVVLRISILAQFFRDINLFKGIVGNCRLLMIQIKAYLFLIYSQFIPNLFKVYSRFIPDLLKVFSRFIPALSKVYPRFFPNLYIVYS